MLDRVTMIGDEVELRVFDNHGLIDDRGIPFESYQVEIDLMGLAHAPGPTSHADLVRALANYLAVSMSREFACEARLVENFQTTIALYDCGDPTRKRDGLAPR